MLTNSTEEREKGSNDINSIPTNLSIDLNKPNTPVFSNNLEIRKLHVSDSGWYECQLSTKPTQINYVYLEILGNQVIIK